MARDEWLLQRSVEHGESWLRFYSWSRPTLSLGYFQPFSARHHHRTSRACQVVRRASGGGAILHDQELTYCLAVPIQNRFADHAAALYRIVHEQLISCLETRGIHPALHNGKEDSAPFLCFQRRSKGDVILNGKKIAGSAQRRHARALLQHGSVLLAGSVVAPELPGLWELTGRKIRASDLSSALAIGISSHLGLHCAIRKSYSMLGGGGVACAVDRFRSARWTFRR